MQQLDFLNIVLLEGILIGEILQKQTDPIYKVEAMLKTVRQGIDELGEIGEVISYVDIEAWGDMANTLCSVREGSLVRVLGELHQNLEETDHEIIHSNIVVRIQGLELSQDAPFEGTLDDFGEDGSFYKNNSS